MLSQNPPDLGPDTDSTAWKNVVPLGTMWQFWGFSRSNKTACFTVFEATGLVLESLWCSFTKGGGIKPSRFNSLWGRASPSSPCGGRGGSGAPLAGTGWTGGGTAAGSAPCSSGPFTSGLFLSAVRWCNCACGTFCPAGRRYFFSTAGGGIAGSAAIGGSGSCEGITHDSSAIAGNCWQHEAAFPCQPIAWLSGRSHWHPV